MKALKSWHRIPPVPPSTPRQKIPSRGLVVVFMSAFFLSLSLSSLSLSRAVFTIKWSRRNWHPPDTIKHLKSYYSKSKLLRTNTLKCIAPFGYSMSRTFVLITHNNRVQRQRKKRNFTRHSLSTRDTRPRERRRVKGSETRVANDKIGN